MTRPAKKRTDWVAGLLTQLRKLGIPAPQREVEFHDDRKWRFDLAWPAEKLALEVDGAVFAKGGSRHTSGVGFTRDCEKLNEAVLLGWRVLRVTSGQVKEGDAARWVGRALGFGPAKVITFKGK